MSRSIPTRLRDMIDAIDLAVHHGGGFDASALDANPTPRDATFFRLAVIGEAAMHVPPDVMALAPDVRWTKLRDMRHYLIRGYWQIDLVIVTDTIAIDLGPLRTAVLRLIALLDRAQP